MISVSCAYLILFLLLLYIFTLNCTIDHLDLHSFPTRRSSDLAKSLSTRLSSAPLCVSSAPSNSSCSDRIPTRRQELLDRKSTRLNSSHLVISYAVFCLKKKKKELIRSMNLVDRGEENQIGEQG